MHNFKLGDRVSVGGFHAPFEVIGIRATTVEVKYTDDRSKPSWVNHTKVRPYKQPLTQEYIDGLVSKYEDRILGHDFLCSHSYGNPVIDILREVVKDLKREQTVITNRPYGH